MTGSLSTAKLAAVAIVMGLMAGAGAVYVSGGASGNDVAGSAETGTSTGAPSSELASSASAACPASDERFAALSELAVGEVAAMAPREDAVSLADLSFNDPDGAPTTIADMSGKTLLVNLWATWCAPCREEMPALDALQRQAGGEDFEVVAINIDTGDEEKALNFLDEIGVSDLAFYRDATMGVFNDLKGDGLAFGLPVTLLVDENSCLMAAMNGPAHWSGDDALRLVEGARAI